MTRQSDVGERDAQVHRLKNVLRRLMIRSRINDYFRVANAVIRMSRRHCDKLLTRRALGRAHVPPTTVFSRLAVNKTF